MPRPALGLFAAGVLALAPAAPAAATEVRHFQLATLEAFLEGTLDGVSADPLGRLELADRAERLTALEEPFVFAAAAHPEGWVVGTGNAGRVLRVDRKGQATTLFTAPEPEIFAVWADPDGTVFAGSSPRGKVYRIPPAGEGEVFFDPGEIYIWALARAADGSLLVATGTEGKLFRVTAEGEGEVLYDTHDTHVRSLAALPGGGALVGTAEEGLVLRIEADGTARTLYDASQPEVVALALAPDGDCYAAVVASEASLLERGPARPAAEAEDEKGEGAAEREPTPVVTVIAEGSETPPRRRAAAKGARSELLRIAPGGLVESVWTFREETVYSLGWYRDRLWIGSGLEGKLFSFTGGQMVLEKDLDERQVVALLADDPGPAFASTNAAALYRMTGITERSGTYTSPALDAGQIARFGTLHWEGEMPAGAALSFAFRSGISAEPDRTWSAWTEPRSGPGRSAQVALEGVPAGRFLQWRAHFRAADGVSPRLYGVEVSYRQENLRPKIESLTVLDPGQILVPANFNPTNQVFEPAHPTREGIFTTLEPAGGRPEDRRQKTLWKRGFRTLRWEASDPNGDGLTYALDFRPAAGGDWLPVAEDLDEDYYSFDATVLPDGVYRFRLTASDLEAAGDGAALTAEQVSEPVVVDHTPPVLAGVERREKTLAVTVTDAGSPLREAAVSLDAAEWEPVVPADGLLDGRTEVLEIPRPAAGRLLLLRVTDAAFNVTTFDLSRERSPGSPDR